MTITLSDKRIGLARVARIATADADGRPHVVPVCFVILNDELLWAVDQKPKTTMALRRLSNIAANPAVSVVIDHYSDEWSELWWIRIDGQARVLDSDADRKEALDALAAKYPQYVVDRPRGPVVAITPTVVRTWPQPSPA